MRARIPFAFSVAVVLLSACLQNERRKSTPVTATEAVVPAASVAVEPPVASVASAASAAVWSVPVPLPPCPAEMAQVRRACVDKWEAHLVVVGADGIESVHSPYDRPERGIRYEARSGPSVVPQAYVSRDEARAACEAAGKRLCSLQEWYGACRGPRGFMYPYGPQMTKGTCNASKPHLLSRVYGNEPRKWKYNEHFNDPKLNQEPGFLAKTGEYGGCVSGYGVADMVGNLHEWISDPVDVSLANKIPLRDDIRDKLEKRTGNAIFMGGFFSTTSEHGRGCAFVTIGHEASYHDYSTGFRCCKAARRVVKDER